MIFASKQRNEEFVDPKTSDLSLEKDRSMIGLIDEAKS